MSMWVYFLAGMPSLRMARVVDEVSEERRGAKEGDSVYLYWEYLGVMERMRGKRSSSWAFRRSRAFRCMFGQYGIDYESGKCSRAHADVPFF